MPELPEVETVRRQLEPEIEGQRIEHLRIDDRPPRHPRRELAPNRLDFGQLGHKPRLLSKGVRPRLEKAHQGARHDRR